mgnify:FL=1
MKIPRQFFVFCIVGTIGFIVDVGILYALAPWMGWYAGRLASFVAAATVTWYLNRIFTFGHLAATAKFTAWQQYWRYLMAMMGCAFINYLAYTLTLQLNDAPWAPTLGVAFGSIAGLLVNFVSARKVAFRS